MKSYLRVYWSIKYLLNPLRTAHTKLIKDICADHSTALFKNPTSNQAWKISYVQRRPLLKINIHL